MRWPKLVPSVVVVACVLVIIALAPPTLTDPLARALAEIRQNTMRTGNPAVPYSNGVAIPSQEETSEQKSLK